MSYRKSILGYSLAIALGFGIMLIGDLKFKNDIPMIGLGIGLAVISTFMLYITLMRRVGQQIRERRARESRQRS